MATDLSLVVEVNGVRIGLWSEWVMELIPQARAQRTWLPGTQLPFAGAMTYRERQIAVLDLRAVLHLASFGANVDPAEMQRIVTERIDSAAAIGDAICIVTQADDRMASLVVDDVHTFIEIDREQIQTTSIENEDLAGVYASDELGEIMLMNLPHVFARLSEPGASAA